MLIERWLIKLPLQTAHSPMTAPISDITYNDINMYFNKYIELKAECLYERTLNITDFRFSWHFITDVDSSLGSLLYEDAGSVGDIVGLHVASSFRINWALKTMPLCAFEILAKLSTSTWCNKPISALYSSFSIRRRADIIIT
jgi:hypothetical protein